MQKSAIDFNGILREFLTLLQAYLPRIFTALVLLLLGWAVSYVLKTIVYRVTRRFEKIKNLESKLEESKIQDFTPKAAAALAFWFSFVLFIASAGHVLGLPVVTGSLNRLAAYLPHLLVAVLVVAVGIVLGNLVRTVVNKSARNAGISHALVLGESARITLLVISIMIALGQAGIESTVLVVTFGLVLGGTIGASALAFGIGAKTLVSNLIAGRNVSGSYSNGQRIKVGPYQGRIVQITSSAVILETADGRTQIPASMFDDEAVVLLDEKD
ncbi:hypothetical protein ACFL5V_09320 [Fibrobacterota bacterium]